MERRKFIKAVGLGTSALFIGGIPELNFKSKSFAIQLYTVRDAVAKDLEGTLTRLRKTGYDTIELFGYNGTFFGKTPKEFKAILKNTGIKVVSSHHTSGLGMKGKGTLSDGWEQAVEDLKFVGAKYMACSYLFPQERTKENYDKLPNLLNKSGELARKSGITFAYHNHDFEFEKYEDTLVMDHILTHTEPQYVAIELDLYWISKAGKDPVEYFKNYPGRFPLWHVKDMAAGTKDITEVGHGTIDFKRIFEARKTAGLKQWFVEQDTSKGDIFESIKFSHDYLEKQKFIG